MKNEINFVLEMREARVNKLQSIVKKKKASPFNQDIGKNNNNNKKERYGSVCLTSLKFTLTSIFPIRNLNCIH